jgi:peptidoglycan/xylan/chitin deacetylase (PgdA/CDA1 family)
MSALVCLTYDDALPVHREIVAPELAKRGLRGTFYIPTARDDLHEHPDDWRRVTAMGHELGNHSCFHPCRTRADWDWKPPYRLEEYTRERVHDELLL